MAFLQKHRIAKSERRELRTLRRELKPSMWARAKVAFGGGSEQEKAQVSGFKTLFRAFREKTAANTAEKTRAALHFIGSKYVTNAQREALARHWLGATHPYYADLVSHMRMLDDAGRRYEKNQLKKKKPVGLLPLQKFLASKEIVAAIKDVSEKGRYLPRFRPRRAFTMLTSHNAWNRRLIANGLENAIENQGLLERWEKKRALEAREAKIRQRKAELEEAKHLAALIPLRRKAQGAVEQEQMAA
ncbi:MAG: hypothetical protein WC792_02830 [Candidatus Micrarchaeia archaeon]|jgi:hypothetical protein